MCAPAKTGTTHWQYAMNAIFRNQSISEIEIDETFNYSNLPRMSNYVKYLYSGNHTEEKISIFYRQIEDWVFGEKTKKFINVRHPMARLYSAWKNKFVGTASPAFLKLDNSVKKYQLLTDKKRFENQRVSFEAHSVL